jgi:hypothetical protein
LPARNSSRMNTAGAVRSCRADDPSEYTSRWRKRDEPALIHEAKKSDGSVVPRMLRPD